jgi:hypothetical protein
MSVPSIPVLQVRPDVRDGQLKFFWSPPLSDGGSPITTYILSDSSNSLEYILPDTRTYTISGLTNGITYSFTLAASNANGLGPSIPFTPVQPGTYPDPPTLVSTLAISNTVYQVVWDTPTNLGGNTRLLGTLLTAIPLDANSNLSTNSSLYIYRTVAGGGAGERQASFITLNSPFTYKIELESVNDPGYSQTKLYTSSITTLTPSGAMSFSGSTSSYLAIGNDIDFRLRTGDFTIEWFQYQTAAGSFPRIFSIGTYSSASIAVSIEGGTFYLWVNGSAVFSSSVTILNQWVHFAVCRSGTSLRVFRNGTQIGTTITNSSDINDTVNAFTMGNETTKSVGASYQGLITNFRWVKGSALYTANFTRPSAVLQNVTNTKLLLIASSAATVSTDTSSTPKTVTNSNVTYSSSTPF